MPNSSAKWPESSPAALSKEESTRRPSCSDSGHQSAQLKAALPEGQAARSPAGGLQRLRQGQVLRAQKDLYLRAAGQGGQGLVQQGPQAGQIGGRFRKGLDFLPHQRERLLGHLFPAQIELALVVQHVLGDAASGLGFDAGDLPVDVLIGLRRT